MVHDFFYQEYIFKIFDALFVTLSQEWGVVKNPKAGMGPGWEKGASTAVVTLGLSLAWLSQADYVEKWGLDDSNVE